MKRSLAYTTVRILLLTVLVSMFSLGTSVTNVKAQETEVVVTPSSVTIGEEGVPFPTPPYTINITIIDVTELWAWEIKLYFDDTILNCTPGWVKYPADHVFAGQTIVPLTAVVEEDMLGRYVGFGCSLQWPAEPVSTARGTLCQINFTGIAVGTSDLTFSTPLGADTYLLGPTAFDDIAFTVTDGEITVIPELPTPAIMPILVILTFVTAILARRKWSRP